MDQVFFAATQDLASFLNEKLPALGPDWWQRHVVDRLSFQQQRMLSQKKAATIDALDFAALIRLLDQNWHEISRSHEFPRDARGWVKELQSARNRWAHRTAEGYPPSEIYRDADTMRRLLAALGAKQESIDAVEELRSQAILEMAPKPTVPVKAENPAAAAPIDFIPESKSKYLYNIGDVVALRSDRNTIFPIVGIEAGPSETRYRVFRNNSFQTYYESQIQAVTSPSDDSVEIVSAQKMKVLLTARHITSPSMTILMSMRMGRIDFVPYQYRPVLRLIKSDRPRMLIADEVGVGKTIETGLIIKELQARTEIRSILIICPKALVAENKWYNEMRRFDESFAHLDGKMVRHCIKETYLDGEWPRKYEKCIIPFSLFDSDLVLGDPDTEKIDQDSLAKLDPPPKFDLVIVDEAHHIRNPDTYLHQGVKYFCENASAVVFLTATPVQLGSDDLYTLLNVLRPDLVIDRASFNQMAEPNAHINSAIKSCRMAVAGWEKEAYAALELAASCTWGRSFIRESPRFQASFDALREGNVANEGRVRVIRDLEELYTFSSLINRTRRRDIGNFATRSAQTIRIEYTDDQRLMHDVLLDIIARILMKCHGKQNVKFMMTTVRRQAASCLYGLAPMLKEMLIGKLDQVEIMEATESDDGFFDTKFIAEIKDDISQLLKHAETLDPRDPKAEAFVRVVKEKASMHRNKALVFTTFRHTINYLTGILKPLGIRLGVVHGSINDEDRRETRKRFALQKDDPMAIDVLISSEVGCEGLDFQFCDLLINYDLPWNPMRIEQRIGRIDRYGQSSETVAIVNMVTPGTVDADIYDRCLSRIGVFQQSIGGNEEILGVIAQEISKISDSYSLSPEERALRLQQLADNSIRLIHEEQQLEEKQVELFGLNVPGTDWREEIKRAESHWLSAAAIESCVSSYIAALLDSDRSTLASEKSVKHLRVDSRARGLLLDDFTRLPKSSDEAYRRWERWLKNDKGSVAVTFEQSIAADDSAVEYINALHPLARQAAAHFETAKSPLMVHLAIKRPDFPEGMHNFGVYRWTYSGVKKDERLVVVSDSGFIDDTFLDALSTSTDEDPVTFTNHVHETEKAHHQRWVLSRADHIQSNREIVEQRIQSLGASHGARCRSLEDIISKTGNEKIVRMRQSELNRVAIDFERRIKRLQEMLDGGDIQASLLIAGSIRIHGGKK